MPSGTDYAKWASIEASIEDDDDDKARARLRDLKNDMTEEENRRIHDCWREPEFQKMFHDYAEEVSDPANKAEQERYLAQVEAEQRAEKTARGGGGGAAAGGDLGPGPQPEKPAGSELLKPLKGFVLKTWQRPAGKSDFDRDTGKVFINVCVHGDIEKPSAKVVTAPDGRQGQSWSMPHLVSPKPKDEKDKSGHMCVVVDIVFHPEVVSRCDAPPPAGERWKEMVASTAVEMVGKLHQLDLDPQYKLLKVRYFGDTGEGPSTMSWKPASAFEGKGETGVGGGAAAAAAPPPKAAPAPTPTPAPQPTGRAPAAASERAPPPPSPMRNYLFTNTEEYF